MMNSYQHIANCQNLTKKRKIDYTSNSNTIGFVQSNYSNNLTKNENNYNSPRMTEFIVNADNTTINANTTKTRSKKGCFTCRKRKKKCNESFPVCSGCARNLLQCCWPSFNDETLPRSFQIKPASGETETSDQQQQQQQQSQSQQATSQDQQDKQQQDKQQNYHFQPSLSMPATPMMYYNKSSPYPYSQNYENIMYVDPLFASIDNDNNSNNINNKVNRSNYPQESNYILENEDYEIPINFCSTIELNSYKHSLPFPENHIPNYSNIELTLSFDTNNNENNNNKNNESVEYEDSSSSSSDENTVSSPCLSELSLTSSYTTQYDQQTIIPSFANNTEFSSSISDLFSSLFNTINSYKFQWIPDVQLNDEDAMLYQEFVTTYIPTISPSHSHPLLSPDSIFVPQASRSAALREIFYTCGASILALKKPDQYQKIASKHYQKAINLIQKEIKSSSNITEDWLFVAVQTLCLLDRSMGLGANRCAKHLIAAYDIIKERELLKIKKNQQENKNNNNKNELITPNERSLFDSFVFNYVITIYFCHFDDLVQLPSPFKFFDEYHNYLTYTIYRDNKLPNWSNSPVMGSATDCFECLGRLFWLLRYKQMNYINDIEFRSLLNTTRIKINYTLKTLMNYENELKELENQQQNQNQQLSLQDELSSNNGYKSSINKFYKGNLEISKVIYHALEILYHKLNFPDLSSSNKLIQFHLENLIKEYSEIPELDHSKCLTISSLFIAGCASTTLKQREYITKELYVISSVLSTTLATKLSNKLEELWFNDVKIVEFNCFDVLLTREGLDGLSF